VRADFLNAFFLVLCMLSTKLIKARVDSPTCFKRSCLDFEWVGFQHWMIFGKDLGIYSSYKTAKNWKYKTIKYKNYNLCLWSQWMKLEKSHDRYWLLFKTKKKLRGVWLPLKLYQSIPEGWQLKDSFMHYNESKDWYEAYLVFQKEIPEKSSSHILAVDIGERVMATVCGSWNTKPIFFGKEIRGIRRHYAYLRQRLGKNKKLEAIRKVGNNEKNKVNSLLHKISKQIVEIAEQNNATIVLGDLKGIKKSAVNKGKRIRRIINNFPHWKLKNYIQSKASQIGIKVVIVNESYTSQTCSRCGELGMRQRAVFKCVKCNYQLNADFNGTKNILRKLHNYKLCNGAAASAQMSY